MTHKKEILVVDDNLLNREMLVAILEDDYKVLQAENGIEALDILSKDNDVALILLDVMMPIMDGYAFLKRIKQDRELSLLPVIVLTQGNSEADEVAALAHGATDFVPKPYRPQVIRHRIESLINLRETAAMVNQFRYDRLTGLYSKQYFFQKAQEKLSENPDKEYCLVCCNIDNFKLFNDTYGVAAGDELLKEIAQILRSTLDSKSVFGRFESDKFICLQESAKELADRQCFGMGNIEPSSYLKKVVMRWGIYQITDRSVTIDQMCDRAMLAVNSIKGQYNQFFAEYDDVLRNKLLREKSISDAMETALAQNQFSVYLQPKYSLTDRTMVGAEALVRWIHPKWGIVPPNEFIPLFEKNGFIFSLDKYVWEKVCSILQDWKRKGYDVVPISVNVSRLDIYRHNIEEFLRDMLAKYEIEPSYLHLELTESAYAENQEQIISTVNNLRKMGFVLEMDDFGSGYSSLSMLSRMRLDILKLDMKFVSNETSKPLEYSILNDVINMAHRMHLGVVAEGVETREQMKRLQLVGCDYVQGYFFSKPLPLAEFEELLTTQSHAPHAEPLQCQQTGLDLYRVIVADESQSFRKNVVRGFDGEYETVEVENAESAIEKLKSFGGNGVSAVILSMTLPDDGAAKVMKFLRQETDFWNVPVLATIPSSGKMDKLPLAKETDDFLCKLHPVFDIRKRVQRLIDVAEANKRVSVLENEACRDYMTNLLNRRGLHAAMDALHTESLPLAVCVFDLDTLKKVNDAFGHGVGDSLILTFTDLLKTHTRSNDVLCRYGGDEFVVILKNIKDEESAVRRVNEICKLFGDSFNKENLTASCSAGIAFCGLEEIPTVELIDRADQALYRAKRELKGGCCVWK